MSFASLFHIAASLAAASGGVDCPDNPLAEEVGQWRTEIVSTIPAEKFDEFALQGTFEISTGKWIDNCKSLSVVTRSHDGDKLTTSKSVYYYVVVSKKSYGLGFLPNGEVKHIEQSYMQNMIARVEKLPNGKVVSRSEFTKFSADEYVGPFKVIINPKNSVTFNLEVTRVND